MVAIRHTASNEQQRTTMILLCEDGSLRIYMANVDNTSYWLQPSLQPTCGINIMKPVRKRKAAATGEFVQMILSIKLKLINNHPLLFILIYLGDKILVLGHRALCAENGHFPRERRPD